MKKILLVGLILGSVGCAPNNEPERVASVSSAQFDGGLKEYSIYRFRLEDGAGTRYDLAEVLVMNEDVGSYQADTEYWRFASAGLDELYDSGTKIIVSADSYDDSVDPLSGNWPPSGSWSSNDLEMPKDVSYGTESHGDVPYEFDHAEELTVRLQLDIAITSGEASGTVTWFHDEPSYGGYLLDPDTDVTMDLNGSATWSDPDWREYHFDSGS